MATLACYGIEFYESSRYWWRDEEKEQRRNLFDVELSAYTEQSG